MGAIKTALSVTGATWDSNDHLADVQMFTAGNDATLVPTQGLAAVYSYEQVAKLSGKHAFEMLLDNSGPKRTGLDVSVWNPAGSSLLGELQDFSLKFSIPNVDGSGIGDLQTYSNASGAKKIVIDATGLVPSSASLHAILAKMASATLADRSLANVTLNFGLSFDLPMTMGNAKLNVQRDQGQSYDASFSLRGTPTTKPTGTTIWGVVFAGDCLLTVSIATGHGTMACVGLVTDMALTSSNGAVTKASGNIDLQGAWTYS